MHTPAHTRHGLIRPHLRSGLTTLAALAFLAEWTGCGASEMTMFFLGDTKKLNTCGGNTAQSVVVRIYQLSNTANFRKATSESFWQNDRGVLADELLERTEITVYPGDVREGVIKPAVQAAYIGVAADFCKPERDLWRQIYALEGGAGELVVELFEGSTSIKYRFRRRTPEPLGTLSRVEPFITTDPTDDQPEADRLENAAVDIFPFHG